MLYVRRSRQLQLCIGRPVHKGGRENAMTSRNCDSMRLSAVPVFKYVLGVGGALLLFVVAGCNPGIQEAEKQLPEPQARELQVYSTQHATVFDLRIHSMDTCPFLTYGPHVAFSRHDTPEYASWLHDFYMHKHLEEKDLRHCTCDEELSRPAGPAITPAGH